jgi:hypothetical protein
VIIAERGDIKIRGDKREEEEATEVWPAEEEEATLHGCGDMPDEEGTKFSHRVPGKER